MHSDFFSEADLSFHLNRDPELIALLNEQVHTLHHRKHPDVFAPYNYEQFLPVYENALKQENTYCVIAYVREKPVGYALMYHRQKGVRNPFLNDTYEFMQIDEMAVLDGYRHQGIGKKLVDFVRGFCKKKGIDRIQLSVWTDNEMARVFYERTGFVGYLLYMEMRI